MSKQQMIEAIRQHNRSASEKFLVTFDDRTLDTYLRRLTFLSNHRGRDSHWTREPQTTAIVSRVV